VAAAQVLGGVGDEDRARAVEALLVLCDDASGLVRHAAMFSLADLGAREAVPRLLDGLEDGTAPVRQAAVLALAEIGDGAALERLREACADERPEVRFQAVAAVARLDPQGAAGMVRGALDDRDAEVRVQAIEVFEEIGGADVRAAVAPLVGDPDPRVRLAAALAVGRIGHKAGADVLLAALANDATMMDAAEVLGKLGETRAIAPLRAHLHRWLAHPFLKAAAAAALHRLGAPEGRAHLLKVLSGRRWEVKAFAAELCADLGLVEARPQLERLRDRPGPLDRDTIAAALERLA
jgi:HEAT repeat protein